MARSLISYREDINKVQVVWSTALTYTTMTNKCLLYGQPYLNQYDKFPGMSKLTVNSLPSLMS